jgi:hypothetical protein
MSLERKLLHEISRYNRINNYIQEQVAPGGPAPEVSEPLTPEPGTEPTQPDVPPPPAEIPAEPIDIETDTEVEKVDNQGNEETEELDITDLVDSQKNIETKQEEYFDNLFKQLETLQTKLAEMDNISQKLNSMEEKIEKYRPKTAEEKLELRSLDSYPFNQKLTDFFEDKEEDFEKTGKEYVLTSDDVDNFTASDVKDSFNDGIDTEEFYR